jgi:uncharacterized membrane protein
MIKDFYNKIKFKKSELVILIIIAASFAISVYFYPQMPDRVASHWNAAGEVNGYMSKSGFLLMPLVSVFLFLFFIFIPKIDPLKENIKKFREIFDNFILIIVFMMFYIQLLTIFWNIGYGFNMTRFIIPILGILYYYMGVLIENSKRNWSIGIRTPWTLSSEKVWDKTSKVGGKLFKFSGIISLIGILLPGREIIFAIAPIIFVSLYLVYYSYAEYKKEISNNGQ